MSSECFSYLKLPWIDFRWVEPGVGAISLCACSSAKKGRGPRLRCASISNQKVTSASRRALNRFSPWVILTVGFPQLNYKHCNVKLSVVYVTEEEEVVCSMACIEAGWCTCSKCRLVLNHVSSTKCTIIVLVVDIVFQQYTLMPFPQQCVVHCVLYI